MSARRVVVVGAGAAGLTASIRAAEADARVTLLNAHPKVGLKILMSGGTRCNVTHREVSERDFNGGSRPFVARVLRAFDVPATLAWFESLGVELKLEETGKYFPVSDDAQTVLDALLGAVARVGVGLEAGARCVRLSRVGEGFRLGIQDVAASAMLGGAGVARIGEMSWPLPAVEPDRWIEADRVVVASGGLSFPRTGSDGVGYALLTALGHTLEPPVPALTPLAAEDPLCRALQGVTVETELRLMVDGARVVATRGSMLFAHFGYTGPAALDLSRHWLKAAGERQVVASFLPGETEESAVRWFNEESARAPRTSVRALLGARMPDQLAVELCREVNVDPAKLASQVTRGGRVELLRLAVARVLPVTGVLGYEKAEVTAGGVRLAEVNPSTLESRVVPGLYLCGEVLDVEGRLGGFNFQWSWSSGTVAGRAAAQ